jgi:uncharacterized membrane protein YbhN (UPF0104 family)
MAAGTQFVFTVFMVLCMIFSYINISLIDDKEIRKLQFKAVWWMVAAYMISHIII